MSRYKPANGMGRCPVCKDVTDASHRHTLFERLLWRWDRGQRGRVIAVGAGVLTLTTCGVTIVRDLIGV